MSIFHITKGTKHLLIILSVILAIGFLSAYLYYNGINKTEDPRVLEAKKSFAVYNKLMSAKEYDKALLLLDKILQIYKGTPGYEQSFENGVAYNNKAAIHLVMVEEALFSSANAKLKDNQDIIKSLQTAKKHTLRSIQIYTDWSKKFQNMPKQRVYNETIKIFDDNNPAFKGLNTEKIRLKRTESILLAQKEIKRRLSVSHTNLGVINRYLGQKEDAKKNYELALNLWPDNYIAKNNLNVLLGKPIKKRSIIKKLFPPERKK